MALYTSLVDIWSSRPDLKAAFPQGLHGGTQDNAKLNAWWNSNGANEYPNVQLVPPGDSRIQSPTMLTKEAQAGQSPAPSAYQPAGQAPGSAPSSIAINPNGSAQNILDQVLRGYGLDVSQVMMSGSGGDPQNLKIYDRSGKILYNGSQYFDNRGNPISQQTNTQTNTQPVSTTNGTQGGTAIPQTTGNPIYDELLVQLNTYLDELRARGQVVNPNVELTPEQLAAFTAQAESEIDPYYAGQLKIAREDLLRSIGYSQQQILDNEKKLETQYGQTIRQLAESAADRGFAQSGIRQREEGEAAQAVQTQIGEGRRNLENVTGTAARTFAKAWGGTELPSMSINEAPRVLAGESKFQASQRTLPTYNISDSVLQGLIGSEEYNRRAAVRTRASGLEEAQRTLQGIDQSRKLTL